jgi:hypothetical protein
VGDVHQPVQVSFDDGRGANGIRVSGGGCHGNLHAARDTCLVERALGAAAQVAAERQTTAADRAAWALTGPVAWANEESFAIATAPATGYREEADGACRWTPATSPSIRASPRGRRRSTRPTWRRPSRSRAIA